MAKQEGILPFTGTLGDRVGYHRNGKYFFRRKALEVKQTAATKLAAKDFGTASRSGAQLRRALGYSDTDVITRLNKALTGVIRNDAYRTIGERRLTVSNMQLLQGFHFNDHGCYQRLLSCAANAREEGQGSLQIVLPAFRPNAPKGVTHVSIKAIVISANIERNAMQVMTSQPVVVTNRKQCDTITLNVPPVPGICAARKGMRIVLIEVQPQIKVNGELLTSANKQGYALDILAVLPPVVEKVKRLYSNKTPKLKIIPGYENRYVPRVCTAPFIAQDDDLSLLPARL